MKMGELSERSGLPVGTIKFYLRAGLIEHGEATQRNQANYDEHHLRRLRLIRALADVGGLSLATITEVLAAVDDHDLPLHDAFGLAQDGLVEVDEDPSPDWDQAAADVDDMVARLGWLIRPHARSRNLLISAMVTLRRFGWSIDGDFLDGLAMWVAPHTEFEIGYLDPQDRSGAMEVSVIGTVGIEQALAGLRRMALEHQSAKRFADQVPDSVTPRRAVRSVAGVSPDGAASPEAPSLPPRPRRPRR